MLKVRIFVHERLIEEEKSGTGNLIILSLFRMTLKKCVAMQLAIIQSAR
jgi:hypothetical protein